MLIQRPRGSIVRIDFSVTNALTTPPEPLDPNEGAFVSIYHASGALIVNEAEATRLWKGRYRYLWQTAEINPYGVYDVVRIKKHDGRIERSVREPTFELVVP